MSATMGKLREKKIKRDFLNLLENSILHEGMPYVSKKNFSNIIGKIKKWSKIKISPKTNKFLKIH